VQEPAGEEESVPAEEPGAEEESVAEESEADEESVPAEEPAAEDESVPEEAGAGEAFEGEALAADRCTECHDLARVERASYSQDEWEQVVSRMVGNGANLTEDEQAVVVAYLTETYGP
jgi:hypothetical protein